MKLVLAFVASAALATPVFACPNMDHDEAPRTAEKDKAPAKTADKAKEQPKKDAPKATDTAKAKDTKTPKTAKKGDKVSIR